MNFFFCICGSSGVIRTGKKDKLCMFVHRLPHLMKIVSESGHFDFHRFCTHQQGDQSVNHKGMLATENFVAWLKKDMSE